MRVTFNTLYKYDELKQENLKLKNRISELEAVIERKDLKICELNIKLINRETKLEKIIKLINRETKLEKITRQNESSTIKVL